MSGTDDIVKVLEGFECGIGYKAVSMEPDSLALFPEFSARIVYTIQPVASLIPADECEKARSLAGNRSAFMFIPGRAFDATGTRHGKGAGWYDRFLSMAPKEWLRIGICYDEQFSNELLRRESWDEPMDWVCVVDRTKRKATCHETHAREDAA